MTRLLGATDWIGLSAFLTALTTAIVSAIGALVAAVTSLRLRQPVTEVHAAVTTPPDAPALGQVVAETADKVDDLTGTAHHIADTVNGHTPPGGTPEVQP